MTRIVLEKIHKIFYHGKENIVENRKLGEIVIYTEDLTPEFINSLKADTTNKMKWSKAYKDILKAEGYDVD